MSLARHRHWLAAGVACLVLGALLAARHAYVRRQVDQAVASAIDESLRPTRADVEAWARRRMGQATLLHLVAQQSDAGHTARFTSSDALRRLFGDVAAMEHDAAITYGSATGDSVAVGSLGASLPARAGISLVSAADGPHVLFVVDGSATSDSTRDSGARPIPAPRGPTRSVLAIEAVPRPDAFVSLDPASSGTHTGRTTLLARDGDSAIVVASKSNGRGVVPRAFALSALPEHVRSALTGRSAHGVGTGMRGRTVIFGTAPVLAPGWALVREQDEDEIYAHFRSQIFEGDIVYGAIGTLLLLIALGTHRVVRTRRERLLTELRADFVASASHELRTPLAKVKMFAQLLQNGALRSESDAQRALTVIEKEADRLAILVDNLLSFSRLRHRAASGDVVPSDVGEVVTQVAADFAALAAERDVALEIDVRAGLVVSVDSSALRQILINFLENAVKYGPPGQTIRLAALPHGASVRVQVDDEGPGIPAVDRPNVWKPFHRLARAISSGEAGSGIGLSVVHDLVSHASGSVSVEDAPGGGARFIADLPRVAA